MGTVESSPSVRASRCRAARFARTFACVLAVTLPGACRQADAARSGVTLAGSTSVQPFAERWAEEYTGGLVTVQSGGSTAGIKAVHDGTAQVGMSSRALHPEERTGLVETVVAYDAVAVIVHATNPVSSLSIAQLRAIYAGQLRFWSEVGGPHRPITVITREEGSGTRETFEHKVMGTSRIRTDALVTAYQGGLRKMVAEDRDAIGYLSLSRVTAGTKPLALDGIVPSESSVARAAYPLSRPFLFLTRGTPGDATAAFLRYVTSTAGQALAREEGLVPIMTAAP